MNNKSKKSAELADKILKEMTTPEERGFICMYPDNCDICIKAAEVGETTTACEDELEDPNYKEKTNVLDGKFELGLYITPHIDENDIDQQTPLPKSNKKIWRVWLRLSDGGIIGIPFPAIDVPEAHHRAFLASKIFNGELLELEDLGFLPLRP